MNTVREVAYGIWLITFPTKEEVVASACGHLVPPLIDASKKGRLVVIANVPPDLRLIEPSVSAFWLDAMTKRGVLARAVAVVTKSLAVKTVVGAFGIAMKISNKPIEARTFPTEGEAIVWAHTL